MKNYILFCTILTFISIGSCQKKSAADDEPTRNDSKDCAGTTVTDADGNSYHVISIGSQCWMKENLKTSKYQNGDDINSNLDNSTWIATTTGAYSNYDNDDENNTTYGKLYNWHAVMDERNICPKGWHIPTKEEWLVLVDYIGDTSNAGGKLKSTSTLWEYPNESATDSVEFSALPGGRRSESDGAFYSKGHYGFYWASGYVSGNVVDGYYLVLSTYDNNTSLDICRRALGNSCRCVKD